MKKIQNMLRGLGEQVETYAPLMESTGYEISKIEVNLLFGIIPSITPHIAKVTPPDINKITQFLRGSAEQSKRLLENYDAVLAELELIGQKIIGLESIFIWSGR
jgi:hypothetical protein